MKKLLLIILIMGSVFSCNDRLEELNKPTKRAEKVPAEPLFANGVREMFDLMTGISVNVNVFRLYAQYWAQTTYPDESQYNMVNRQIPDNFWQAAYRDVLMDLNTARQRVEETAEEIFLPEDQKINQLAIIDVCKVYMFSVLVDAFGAIPYTEALNPEILNPKYDAGSDVYNSLIETLNSAIATMDEEAAGFSSQQDLVFAGDVAGWKKFANSLKVRLAVNISDVDAAKAGTMINEAIVSGVFEPGEKAALQYLSSPPNTSPIWEDLVQSGRRDFVVSNTLVDQLTGLNDPRLPVFAQLYSDPDAGPIYKGGIYGSANSSRRFSRVGAIFHTPELEGILIDYTLVQFWLAEVASKGIALPSSAEEYYKNAITSSLGYWGVDQAGIDAYLTKPEVAFDAGDWKQKVGIQQWIAQYNNSFEGWTTWRRLDFEGFNVPAGLQLEDIPKRLIFPIKEATLNPTSSKAAAALIGSDDAKTRVFWDVK